MSKIYRLLRNPLFGLGVGLLGIGLALYFGLTSREYGQLTYKVNTIRTSIVKNDVSSLVEVLVDGSLVESDVSSAQITIWNSGKKPIKSDNVLRRVNIVTENSTPIVDAVVLGSTREIVGFDLDKGELKNGVCGVTWSILEHNDGAKVQLIFLGGTSTGVRVDGVIEGKRPIERMRNSKLRRSELVELIKETLSPIVNPFVIVGAILFAVGMVWFETRQENALERRIDLVFPKAREFSYEQWKMLSQMSHKYGGKLSRHSTLLIVTRIFLVVTLSMLLVVYYFSEADPPLL